MNRNLIDQDFLNLLCNPSDGQDLRVEKKSPGSDASTEYTLVSNGGSSAYPVRNGVPRFVESDQYAGNFSHEWTVHRKTQLDDNDQNESEKNFAEKTGWKPEDLRGKRILDVGCGMGRFADVALRWGAEVIGIDLSFAVDSANANLGDNPKFHCAQTSVFDLPFKPESFDMIYSIGVLHHTPDCEKAFKCLPRLLKPGGEIVIWLYSAHSYPHSGIEEVRDRFYRRYTTKMNSQILHSIFRFLCLVPIKPRALWHMLLPGAVFHAIPRLHDAYSSYQWRLLDSFDWYSPTFQTKHSYPEVCRWFRDMGLVDITPLDVEVSVRGSRPA